MKHVEPLRSYEGASGYPSSTGETVGSKTSRREVLRALAAGLGAGAAALAAGPDAGARSTGLHRITLPLARRQHFGGCDLVVDRLELQTPDARLAAFLGDLKERPGLQAAAALTLGGASCADLTDRTRLSALEQRLGRALAALYRARTRRTAPAPIVTLAVTQSRPPVPGGISLPSRPVPRP